MQFQIYSTIQNKTLHKFSTTNSQKHFKSVQAGSDRSMTDVVDSSINSYSMNSVSSTMSHTTHSSIAEEVCSHSTKMSIWRDEDFALSLQTPSHQKHILPHIKQLPDELYHLLLSYCKIHYLRQVLEKSMGLFDTILYRELWQSGACKSMPKPNSLFVVSNRPANQSTFSPQASDDEKSFHPRDAASPRRGSTESFNFVDEFDELSLVQSDEEVMDWFCETEFQGNQCQQLKQLRETQIKLCSIENEILNLVEEMEEVVCYYMKKTDFYKTNSKEFKIWLRQLSSTISDNLHTAEEQVAQKNDWNSSLRHLILHRNICLVEISNTLYQVASYFSGQKLKKSSDKKSRHPDLPNHRRMIDPSDDDKLMVCESYRLPSVLLEHRKRSQASNSTEEFSQLATKLENFYSVICSLRKKHKRVML